MISMNRSLYLAAPQAVQVQFGDSYLFGWFSCVLPSELQIFVAFYLCVYTYLSV